MGRLTNKNVANNAQYGILQRITSTGIVNADITLYSYSDVY